MQWTLVAQIVTGIALITLILLQPQGTGLGKAWGGGNVAYHSKKGIEKAMFIMTVSLAILFVFLAIYNLI